MGDSDPWERAKVNIFLDEQGNVFFLWGKGTNGEIFMR